MQSEKANKEEGLQEEGLQEEVLVRVTVHRCVNTNLKNNLAPITKKLFEGKEHLVIPCIMAQEGVMNNAFLSELELKKSTQAWNYRPVPILHPKKQGEYSSANDPDVIQKNVIGHVFNTKVEDKKLKSELWLDITKAVNLGYSDIIENLGKGKMMEVSTGYFCDAKKEPGIYRGRAFDSVHVNLKPDHLAILPTEVGACSLADGCGTPRTNTTVQTTTKPINPKTKGKESMPKITKKECKPCDDLEKLHTNGSISAEQFNAIQDMATDLGADNLKALVDIMQALAERATNYEKEEKEEKEDQAEETNADVKTDANKKEDDDKAADKVKANQVPMDLASLSDFVETLVANTLKEFLPVQMQETSKRNELTQKLKANTKNVLSDYDMSSLPVDVLEKMEKALRDKDYSGKAGFKVNGKQAKVVPLAPPKGLLLNK